MRMSTNKDDPGYVNLRRDARVTVNGHAQEYCITADEERGEAWCYKVGEIGNLVLNDDNTGPVIECIRGDVVITIPSID